MDKVTYPLLQEHKKWLNMFTNPNNDPKIIISEACGYSIEQAKQALNETLNGSKQWGKFIEWLKAEFPLLYSEWIKTDVSKTGNNIASKLETVLMLDESIFKYADEMGIKLTYEYDGYGIFCNDGDNDIQDKLKFISNYLTFKAKEKWGVPVVVKIKPVI